MDKRDGIKKRLDNIVNDLLLSGEKDLILLGELLRLIMKTMAKPKDFVGEVWRPRRESKLCSAGYARGLLQK